MSGATEKSKTNKTRHIRGIIPFHLCKNSCKIRIVSILVEEKYSSSLDDNTLLSNFGITRQISSKSQINITITHSSYHMLNLYPPVFVFAVTPSLFLSLCVFYLCIDVCAVTITSILEQ